MTITDLAFRQLYLFEFEDTPSGVILLSYTWDDSATKFGALSDTQKLEVCLKELEQVSFSKGC